VLTLLFCLFYDASISDYTVVGVVVVVVVLQGTKK
jgi:hypothetical protein